ncbi:MAG TPA: hypothetical protein VKX96_05560 [Chloroflexota bacterium]|nr:hypothetical protein [Chloroflexota bacterium]
MADNLSTRGTHGRLQATAKDLLSDLDLKRGHLAAQAVHLAHLLLKEIETLPQISGRTINAAFH